MKESVIQSQIAKILRKNGWLVNTLVKPPGWADISAHKAGRSIFIEVKTEKGKVTRLQEHMINQFKKQGFEVYVMRHRNDLENIVI